MLVPTLLGAWRRREAKLAFASVPAFLVLRVVNGIFLMRALASELVLRRTLAVHEKGH